MVPEQSRLKDSLLSSELSLISELYIHFSLSRLIHHLHQPPLSQQQSQDILDYNQQMSVGPPPSVSQTHQALNTSYENVNATATAPAITIGRSLSQSGTIPPNKPLQKINSRLNQSGGAFSRGSIKTGSQPFNEKHPQSFVSNYTFLARPLSKMASFVLHFPIPHFQVFQHERNQRFVVLYGFGSHK